MKDLLKMSLYFAGSILWAICIHTWAPQTVFWLALGLIGSFALGLKAILIVLKTRFPQLFRK
jgi:hypothetical protein